MANELEFFPPTPFLGAGGGRASRPLSEDPDRGPGKNVRHPDAEVDPGCAAPRPSSMIFWEEVYILEGTQWEATSSSEGHVCLPPPA